MRLKTQSLVAIAAILDIVIHGAGMPVPLASIGARQRVSVSYLEQLFRKMRQKGLVVSHRGPGGGYRLHRALASISVADVIDAVDRDSLGCPCNGADRCADPQSCISNGLWCRVSDHLRNYLRSLTLDTVLHDAGGAPRRLDASGNSAAAPRAEARPLSYSLQEA